MSECDNEPEIVSEIIRAAEPFQDPYANFFEEINGWEEEGCDLIPTTSYKYLTFDNTPAPAIDKKKSKKVIKKKPIVMENEEDLDVLLDQSLNINSVPSHEEIMD